MTNLSASSRSPEPWHLVRSLLETEWQRRQQRTKLNRYRPYAKQREFHEAGALHRERLLMGANQTGKTYCGGAEAAFHLTGLYPNEWRGRRFTKPTRGWVGSD